MKEMSDTANEKKWIKYRIKNRFEKRTIPFFGTYVQLDYPYDEYKNLLGIRHVSQEILIVKTLNKITNRI